MPRAPSGRERRGGGRRARTDRFQQACVSDRVCVRGKNTALPCASHEMRPSRRKCFSISASWNVSVPFCRLSQKYRMCSLPSGVSHASATLAG